jgi:hypothetical protein
MLGTLFKALILTVIVLALTAFLGLVIMAGVAGTHGVKPIGIPKNSTLAPLAASWDYSDAYRAPMEYVSYREIHEIIDNVSIKGDGELYRSAREVVFGGTLPGIGYQVSYMLDRDSFPPAVQLVTVYQIRDRKGRLLWKLWRPVHRCLAPYMLDRLAARAPH